MPQILTHSCQYSRHLHHCCRFDAALLGTLSLFRFSQISMTGIGPCLPFQCASYWLSPNTKMVDVGKGFQRTQLWWRKKMTKLALSLATSLSILDTRCMILMAVNINISVIWDVMCGFVHRHPSAKVHGVIS